MSNLENASKAVLEPLLEVDHFALVPADRRQLVQWVMKTAMVFESLGDSRAAFYTQLDRDSVRRGDLPSGYHSLWVGRTAELAGLFCRASDLFDSQDRATDAARAYVTTLGIGSLALQLLTVRPVDKATNFTSIKIPVAAGPWSEIGREVWPSDGTALSWTPTQALRGELGLDELSRRFLTMNVRGHG